MPTVVVIPDLVGLPVSAARDLAHQEGLEVASADVEGPSLGELARPGYVVVTSQHPPPGIRVPLRSVVVIWFEAEDGGAAGDRAPLRPPPDPPAMRAHRRPEDADPSADSYSSEDTYSAG